MTKQTFKKGYLIFLILLIVNFIIFSLDQGGFLIRFKGMMFSLGAPIMKTSRISSYYLTRPFKILIELQENNQKLKYFEEREMKKQGIESQLEEMRRENNFLRNTLELSKKKKKTFLPTQLIGRTDEAGSIIIVDTGTEYGLKGGEAVVLPGYFLIGRVDEAWLGASQITLINSNNFSSAVRGQSSRTEALLSGAKDHLKIEIFNYEDKPKIGELYITSGLDGVFPPGLIAGKLIKLEQQAVATSRIGRLEILIDLNHLEKALILKND